MVLNIRDCKNMFHLYLPLIAISNIVGLVIYNITIKPTHKTLAVCVTGELHRMSVALPKMYSLLEEFDYDYRLFVYVSLFHKPFVADWTLFHALQTDQNAGAIVVYNDTLLPLPRNMTFVLANRRYKPKPQNLLQQLYGEKICAEMVQNYSISHKVVFKYLMRLRSDTFVSNMEAATRSVPKIVKELEDGHFVIPDKRNDWGGLNDRIAIGNVEDMNHYMKRFDDLYNGSHKKMRKYHSETFVKRTVELYGMNVTRHTWRYDEARH